MKALFIMTTLLSLPTLAFSNPKLRQDIEQTYNPHIESRLQNADWSFYGCRIQNIEIRGQDPISFETRKINISLYEAHPKHRGNSERAVILLPPTGGVNVLDRGYANELCSSGITVALVSGWDHQNDVSLDINMHNRGAFRALAATRHVVEFLTSRNIHSIGVLGTSIGAITGALALGYEPRIKTAALIVGSARFADVITETSEQGAAKLRQERMKHYGFKNLEEYRAAVRGTIKIEPAYFMDEAKSKSTLLLTGDADITVPTNYQLEMVEALKPQNHIVLRGNHYQAIKSSFFWHRAEIVKFFKKNL